MARDSGGTYTLPAGNPVVTDTTITSTWGNNTMSDIATELTDSLSRTGKGGMSNPLDIVDGSVSAPGLAFNNDPNTGIYRVTTDTIGITTNGVDRLRADASGIILYHTGTARVSTTTLGADVFGTALNLDNSGAATQTILRAFNSEGGVMLDTDNNGFTFFHTNASGGATETKIQATFGGGVTVYWGGNEALATTAAGIAVQHATATSPLIEFKDNTATRQAYIQSLTSGLVIENEVHGTPVLIQAEDAGGTEKTLFWSDPDGPVIIYHNGVDKFLSTEDGAAIRDPDNAVLKFQEGSTTRGEIFYESTANVFTLRGVEGGADFLLQLRNVPDNGYDTAIQAVSDGAVTLYWDDAARLATAEGGISVTGDIAVTGTVDGRNVATDGSKLDTVDTNAADDQVLTGGTGINATGSPDYTIALDISGLTSMTVAPDGADSFLYNDGGTMKQMTYNQVALPSTNDADAHTFVNGDVGAIRYFTGTTATWTMNSGIGQDDCYIIVVNSGSGTLTLASGTATISSANSLLAIPAGGIACLIRESSTQWFAGGSLE